MLQNIGLAYNTALWFQNCSPEWSSADMSTWFLPTWEEAHLSSSGFYIRQRPMWPSVHHSPASSMTTVPWTEWHFTALPSLYPTARRGIYVQQGHLRHSSSTKRFMDTAICNLGMWGSQRFLFVLHKKEIYYRAPVTHRWFTSQARILQQTYSRKIYSSSLSPFLILKWWHSHVATVEWYNRGTPQMPMWKPVPTQILWLSNL